MLALIMMMMMMMRDLKFVRGLAKTHQTKGYTFVSSVYPLIRLSQVHTHCFDLSNLSEKFNFAVPHGCSLAGNLAGHSMYTQYVLRTKFPMFKLTMIVS